MTGSNIIPVNTANIAQFGFIATFDLDRQVLNLDITGQTTFVVDGINNVKGISFNVTGPGGLILNTVDFSAPDILPATTSFFEIDLPGTYGMFGYYSIQGQIQDADNTIYSTVVINKNIIQPDGYVNGSVPGVISLEADCDIPQLLVNEGTVFEYQNEGPDTISKAGTLSYPRGTLADLDFTETPLLIGGAGFVYTGRYTVNNKTLASYGINDGVIVLAPYVVNQYEQVIECNNSASVLICCVEEVQNKYLQDPFSIAGRSAKAKLDAITIDFYMVILKSKSGQDASDSIARITKALGCDCGCGSKSIEPRPMIGSGLSGLNIVVAGVNSAIVTNSTSGSTKTYTVKVKDILVVNSNNDTSFNITRGVSGSAITYGVSFNMQALTLNVLQTIQNSEDLRNLLLQIIGAASPAVSLAGLANSCVMTISNCNYSLIEPTVPARTIASITIAGTLHNAPGGLSITNTSGILTWLNGLALGTFTAVYDSGTATTIIQINSSANAVTQMVMVINGANINRQFTKTCVGLVDFLNAVTTYICAINTTQIKFGVSGLSISSYDGSGNVIFAAIDPNIQLSALLAEMLAAQAVLFAKVNAIALNCVNIKALFAVSAGTITDADFLLGTKAGSCARLSFSDVAAQVLADIGASSALQSAFCAIVASCSAPGCAPVTSASASLSGTTLTVNCNDAAPSSSLVIRYRIFGAGGSYTNVAITATDLPKAITGASGHQYEVGIQKLCANGAYSPWVTANSAGCANAISFSVVNDLSQFVVSGTLSGSQTKIEVQMTDPNGGVHTTVHDFGATSGTFNVAYIAGLYGDYIFIARAVCDDSSTPRFVSDYTPPVTANYASPFTNNFKASASYGMAFSDISNGTGTGVPTAFNGAVITGNKYGYTPSLSAGTFSVTLTGTVPGLSISIKLVKNGTTIVDTHVISAPGTFTLTNGSPIVYSDQISFEVDLT